MDEFYDKDRFTGSTPNRRPPQKKPDNSGWYSWPLIIVLFALGIWPIALVLLFVNIFSDEKRRKTPADQRKPSAEARMEAAVESAVDRAMAKASAKVGGRKSAAQESMDKARAAAGEKTVTVNGQTYTKTTAAKSTAKKKSKKKEKVKTPGKLLRACGVVLMALGAILGPQAIAGLIDGWSFYLEQLLQSLTMLGGGAIMFLRGQYLANMTRRSQRYILAIGNADTMDLKEIAKRVNRKPDKAARELQKLIDKGYLGEDAYIDYERGYFLRFGATLAPEVKEEPQAPAPKEADEGYSGILRNIRRANDHIADEKLSRKIDRLEQISGQIFKAVDEHPEKRERIRTFFDYYLPTTQKLLDTYAEFEGTGVEGENLRAAKERIEQTMDAIVEGFEHQLDQLYSADAMDVVSDIKVMEAMLNRDTASVAKDFGYDQAKPKEKQGQQLEL